MSVRAYKVLAIELAERPSFNCWHDAKLMDFLASAELYDNRNIDGSGIMEVPVCTLQAAVKKSKVLPLDKSVRAALVADIAWAKQKGQDYIRYECF